MLIILGCDVEKLGHLEQNNVPTEHLFLCTDRICLDTLVPQLAQATFRFRSRAGIINIKCNKTLSESKQIEM